MSDKETKKRKNSNTLLAYFSKKSKPTETEECNEKKLPEKVPEVKSSTEKHESTSSESDPNTSIFDIANYVNKTVNHEEAFDVINKLWTPSPKHNFPSTTIGSQNRRFQSVWLESYTWLSYSAINDGAYCKYCVFFAPNEVGNSSTQAVGSFVKTPFKNWKKAIESFNTHASCKYHTFSISFAKTAKNISEGKQSSIANQLDSSRIRIAKENREKLKPIIKTVIFCGRNGLPLRGHRDSGVFNIDEGTRGEGTFRSLLRYRIDAGDSILKKHLLESSKNATYISWEIQNELINCCNSIILKQLVAEINDAKCFTILADETTDIACKEQLSICVRYFNSTTSKICEHFLQFVPVLSTTGESLATTILSNLQKFGVDLKYLRGQGYDGAASMSGKYNGVQAHVTKLHPKAIYVHCFSHSLNLAISNSTNVQDIRNCIGIVEKLYTFFETPKRKDVLQSKIEESACKSKRHGLKQMCPTRWVERHDSIMIMVELLEPVFQALEQISDWEDRDTSASANLLLNSIRQPNFLISLLILEKLLSYSLPLSRLLQSTTIDLSLALNHVNVLESALKRIRQNADEEFHSIYESAKLKMISFLGSEITIPRRVSQQINRCNVPTNSPEEYFKISTFLPFLDYFLSQLQQRFKKHSDILESFACLLPTEKEPSATNVEKFMNLINFYQTDLEELNQTILLAEFKLWYQYCLDESLHTVMEAFFKCDINVFKNIFKLLKIFITLPISTSTTERSFSTLKRIKSYLRNSTGQDRLNGLATMNIHLDINLSEEEVLEEFEKKSRKMKITI